MEQSAAQASVAARIPFKREPSGMDAASPAGALGLLAVALLAIGVLWWLRQRLQRQSGTAPRLLRVRESQRLGARSTLSVVEFGGRRYLLAQGEQGVQCIDSHPLETVQEAAREGGDAR
jgi:flagellar biogenesis protein FliO